jgi:electron transfer flavoprotein beta subunit
MRIVVCIKQVPLEAELRMVEGRWTIAREGAVSRINPQDLQALEVALGLRDIHTGEVLVMTMGPAQSEEALREAMAMGADGGVLLTDPAFSGADTLATSTVLAQAIRKLSEPPELVFCGTRSTDSDTGQVGPQLAEDLGIPHVAYVTQLKVVDKRTVVVKRRVDRNLETLRVQLPALLTVTEAPSRPRDISFSAIEDAFRVKEILRWGTRDLELAPERVGLAGSATCVRAIREPQFGRGAMRLQVPPQEAAQAIFQALRDRYIID